MEPDLLLAFRLAIMYPGTEGAILSPADNPDHIWYTDRIQVARCYGNANRPSGIQCTVDIREVQRSLLTFTYEKDEPFYLWTVVQILGTGFYDVETKDVYADQVFFWGAVLPNNYNAGELYFLIRKTAQSQGVRPEVRPIEQWFSRIAMATALYLRGAQHE